MTNEQIIFDARCDLMDKGILAPTGRYIEVEDQNGEKKTMEEPEEIHTFVGWQSLGRQVKKGEKNIVSLMIWKHTTQKAKAEDEEDKEKMFMTKGFFFKESQTEPRKEKTHEA